MLSELRPFIRPRNGLILSHNFDALPVVTRLPLMAIASLRRRGGVAISAHAGAGTSAYEIGRGWDTGVAAMTTWASRKIAGVFVRGEKAGGSAVAAVVLFLVVIVRGAELADIGVHGDVTVGGGVLVVCRSGFVIEVRLDVFVFGVVREMEPFDRCSALVADVADDVSDGIGLVAKMTVCDVGDAEAGAGASIAVEGGEEARFHFWGDLFVIQLLSLWGVAR